MGCAALIVPFISVHAEEAEAEAPKVDPEMSAAVKYIEALVDNGYPDSGKVFLP